MAEPTVIPAWLAWIPGVSAALVVLIPVVRKAISWLGSRASQADVVAAIETGRNERVAMLAAVEERWKNAFQELRLQRQEMHRENKELLQELSGRMGKVEQGVARLEGRAGVRR